MKIIISNEAIDDIREIIFKNYRIGYNVSSDSNIIYIRFVIHSKRDLSNFFSKFYSWLFFLKSK